MPRWESFSFYRGAFNELSRSDYPPSETRPERAFYSCLTQQETEQLGKRDTLPQMDINCHRLSLQQDPTLCCFKHTISIWNIILCIFAIFLWCFVMIIKKKTQPELLTKYCTTVYVWPVSCNTPIYDVQSDYEHEQKPSTFKIYTFVFVRTTWIQH